MTSGDMPGAPAGAMSRRPVLPIGGAELALMGITLLWGTTFIIIQTALTVTGPLFFVGLRFATASLSVALLAPSLAGLTRTELVAGVSIGVSIFVGYALQTWALQDISSSTSAFITAVYVPLVPLFQWRLMRRAPHLMSWIGIALAFSGLMLLAGPRPQIGLGSGETLTLISAVAIAASIVLIGYWAGRVNVWRVTMVQLATTSLLAFAAMMPAGETLPAFSWLLVAAACGLGLMSALIQLVMNWAQRSVPPTRATLIYAGEPVWAGLIGMLAGEHLPWTALLGALLIVSAMVVGEIRPGGRAERG